MKAPVFTGSAVAIVTPFTDDFIDFSKLSKLIDFQIENGTDAIVVCGTTGEASTQTIPEHLATIEYCIKHVNGRVPVIAGTGSNDTAHAVMMSQNAEKSGADALLMVTPYYNKTSQAGLIRHYNYVADRVGIPIILYNVPSRTGMSIAADTYRELSKHPNINGVKEASGDLNLIANTRHLCGDDLNLWSGNDEQVIPLMSLGAKGVISTVANIVPKQMSEMTRLMRNGKLEEAAAIQLQLIELIDAVFIEVNPIPIKTALNLMGMEVGQLRMPLCDMLPKNLEILKKAMKNMGLPVKV